MSDQASFSETERAVLQRALEIVSSLTPGSSSRGESESVDASELRSRAGGGDSIASALRRTAQPSLQAPTLTPRSSTNSSAAPGVCVDI